MIAQTPVKVKDPSQLSVPLIYMWVPMKQIFSVKLSK